jgi:hypothetical protein
MRPATAAIIVALLAASSPLVGACPHPSARVERDVQPSLDLSQRIGANVQLLIKLQYAWRM